MRLRSANFRPTLRSNAFLNRKSAQYGENLMASGGLNNCSVQQTRTWCARGNQGSHSKREEFWRRSQPGMYVHERIDWTGTGVICSLSGVLCKQGTGTRNTKVAVVSGRPARRPEAKVAAFCFGDVVKIRGSWGIFGDSSVTLAQWWRVRDTTHLVIRRSSVRFRPKTRQLRFTWIWANRPSSKGSEQLFPVIKAN